MKDIENYPLSENEIHALTADTIKYLRLQGQTELIGDDEEGYIILSKKDIGPL